MDGIILGVSFVDATNGKGNASNDWTIFKAALRQIFPDVWLLNRRDMLESPEDPLEDVIDVVEDGGDEVFDIECGNEGFPLLVLGEPDMAKIPRFPLHAHPNVLSERRRSESKLGAVDFKSQCFLENIG